VVAVICRRTVVGLCQAPAPSQALKKKARAEQVDKGFPNGISRDCARKILKQNVDENGGCGT